MKFCDCKICGEEITYEDIEKEDYYSFCKGPAANTFSNIKYICYDCGVLLPNQLT